MSSTIEDKYKELKVGDNIALSEEQFTGWYHQFLECNIVEVTGFNPPFDIVHWKAPTIYGGTMHTGSKYDDIKKA